MKSKCKQLSHYKVDKWTDAVMSDGAPVCPHCFLAVDMTVNEECDLFKSLHYNDQPTEYSIQSITCPSCNKIFKSGRSTMIHYESWIPQVNSSFYKHIP
jgi:hypothetical protein